MLTDDEENDFIKYLFASVDVFLKLFGAEDVLLEAMF